MHLRTKALDISQKVKDEVWERDNHECILCRNSQAMPNAHYIARSHSGLGVPENIVTLCGRCHHRYDNTTDRPEIKERIKSYLKSKYSNWNEENLVYKKY